MSPEDLSYGDEDHFDANITTSHPHHVESGIGSGADSTTSAKPRVRHVGIQSDPMPDEFYRLQEEEKRREEEEKRRKEEVKFCQIKIVSL